MDIKPENIFLRGKGDYSEKIAYILADFSISYHKT